MEPPGLKTSSSSKARRIMIIAGEASGDMHGGDLAARILAREPGCELYGIAGEQMRAAGVRTLFRIEDIAGLGVFELASTIGRTLSIMRRLRAILRRDPPSLLILIDYAEFNLILAGFARRLGVPVLYYIVPQVWAWRRGRIRKIVRRADRLAVVFPFESEVYSAAGDRVTFVGHPLLDRIRPRSDRTATLARHGFPPDARLITLMPGSRHGEVRYLLAPMVEAALILAEKHRLVPILAMAPTLTESDLRAAAELSRIRIVRDDAYNVIAASDLALAASGTATLETALLQCPMVIAYRMSPVTYAIARSLVKGVDFIGMPNILAGRKVVPELVQGEVTASAFVRAAEPMLSEPLRSETIRQLGTLRERLGTPGAAARVAEIALDMI